MKLIPVLAVAIILLTPTSAQAGVNDFVFTSFSGHYYLTQTHQKYSRLRVEERLVADFATPNQNHGIERAIPKSYQDLPLNPEVISVTNDTPANLNYTTYDDGNGNLVVRIGDADTYVYGEQSYRITYTLDNVVTFYDDHDEFYWDINGDGWAQPFGSVDAHVHIPAELATTLQSRQLCYTGSFGSTSQDCAIDRMTDQDGSVVINVRTGPVLPYQTLSLVAAWDSGTFTQDPWPARKRLLSITAGVGLPAYTLFVMLKKWYRQGKDPAGRGVIVPEYAPPKNFSPLMAATLKDENFSVTAISAELVRLAIDGFVRIHETKKGLFKSKHYQLELRQEPDATDQIATTLLGALFGQTTTVGDTIDLKDKANSLHKTATQLRKDVFSALTSAGYFQQNPQKIMTGYIARGVAVMSAGVISIIVLGAVGIGVLVAGGIIFTFSKFMPVKTEAGVRVKEQILGLKDYMQLAEAERIKYLQSPEGAARYGEPTQAGTTIKLFETLLPYAMIFGLEKDWAKQFKHLYDQPPDWYAGSSSSFTPLIIANSLGGLSAQAKSAFTAPSSSGGSGFSGGGGGGGGGW